MLSLAQVGAVVASHAAIALVKGLNDRIIIIAEVISAETLI